MISPEWEIREFNFIYDKRRKSCKITNTKRRHSTGCWFFHLTSIIFSLVMLSSPSWSFNWLCYRNLSTKFLRSFLVILAVSITSVCQSSTILDDVFISQSHCVPYTVKLLIATHLHPNISLISFLIKNSVGRFPPLSDTHAQYKHKPSDKICYQFLHSVEKVGWRKFGNDE
jgi:hypothetical protein